MQIKWSEHARRDLDAILEQGTRLFGEQTALRFFQQLEKQITLLLHNPYMEKREFMQKNFHKEFRSIVVHQHYKLVYFIDKEQIRIVSLFDTRRNPASLTNYLH